MREVFFGWFFEGKTAALEVRHHLAAIRGNAPFSFFTDKQKAFDLAQFLASTEATCCAKLQAADGRTSA
jgi:hypothetical protein